MGLVRKFRSRWKGNYQEYVRSFITNSSVLDVGCGSHKILPEAVGVDINLWCRPDIIASAGNVPVPDNCFDHVTCLEVIEHIDDPPRVLDELYRVLKVDGSLLITTPNCNWLWNLLLWGWLKFLRSTGQPMDDWNTEHIHTLNTLALEQLARRKFTIRSRKRINLFLMMYELVKTKLDSEPCQR